MYFAVPADHGVKIKENEKETSTWTLPKNQKKLWNIRVTVIPIVSGLLGMVRKRLVKGTGRVGNPRNNRDHPHYNILKISWSTGKSPGDMRRLAVIRTPVKNAYVKNSQVVIIIIMSCH